jgi:AcrR family transcriptional regulator
MAGATKADSGAVAAAPRKPRRAATKGARTRAAILDRAVDLASVEGLEGLTIGRLAGDLGMSKSGLFAHFGSKQDLQLATVAAAAERFRRVVIEPSLAAPDGGPRLRAMAEHYFEYLETFPGGCFWGATASEYDDRPGPVRDAIAAALELWIAELARQAKAAGIADPDRYAFELYAIVMGANSRFRLSGDRRVFEHARAALVRLDAELPA